MDQILKSLNIFLIFSVRSNWGKSFSGKLSLNAGLGIALVFGWSHALFLQAIFRCYLVAVVSGFLALALTLPQILHYFWAQQNYHDPFELKAQANFVIIWVCLLAWEITFRFLLVHTKPTHGNNPKSRTGEIFSTHL